MSRRVVAAVEDLLFRSKISATAESLGVGVEFPRSPKKLLQSLNEETPDLLVLDLASQRFEPLSLLSEMDPEVPTVGFLPHVEKELAAEARQAGCKKVMARGAFTKELPRVLSGENVA
jgi:DNA-binding NtrC family response regulator